MKAILIHTDNSQEVKELSWISELTRGDVVNIAKQVQFYSILGEETLSKPETIYTCNGFDQKTEMPMLVEIANKSVKAQ